MPSWTPSFDLVVATIGRVDPLRRLLDSLSEQDGVALRVLIVDQNEDDRLAPILDRRDLELIRLTSEPGLARARNIALAQLAADVVAFPDDDCFYPSGLLGWVAQRLHSDERLDGLSVRVSEQDGRSDPSWPARGELLTRVNLWTRVASAGLFLRRSVVERVGAFDERLGKGSGTPWTSGEETDYVIRALETGATVAYEPKLTVFHALAPSEGAGLRERGRHEGASVGYLLRKHGYGPAMLTRMAVRPIGGIGRALLHGDTDAARFHAETLGGRIRGYVCTSSANSSA